MLSWTWCSFSNGKQPLLYMMTAQVNRLRVTVFSQPHICMQFTFSPLEKQMKKKKTMPSLILFLKRSYKTPGADNGSIQIQHPTKDPPAAPRHAGYKAPSQRNEEKSGVSHHLWLQSSHGCADSETGETTDMRKSWQMNAQANVHCCCAFTLKSGFNVDLWEFKDYRLQSKTSNSFLSISFLLHPAVQSVTELWRQINEYSPKFQHLQKRKCFIWPAWVKDIPSFMFLYVCLCLFCN